MPKQPRDEYEWPDFVQMGTARLKMQGFIKRSEVLVDATEDPEEDAQRQVHEDLLDAQARYSQQVCAIYGHKPVFVRYSSGTRKTVCFFCMLGPGEHGY
jgi:hypothetical protein